MLNRFHCSAGFITQHAHSSSSSADHPQTPDWAWSELRSLALRQAQRILDPHLAEDAAQEALLRAWRHGHRCSGDPQPWVRTIAHREALRLGMRPLEDLLVEEMHEAQPDRSTAVAERVDLRLLLASLSLPEREALFLRYWNGKTDQEIASTLRAPVGTIKIRIYRAHRKLLQLIENQGLDDNPTLPAAPIAS
jgi:RNA polymerase sigma-70 factor (ECF subfamily)